FGAGKAAGEVRTERLLKYAENPLDSTVLVFLLDGAKPDERKKIVREFRNKGFIFAFPPLSELELKAWLKRRAERQGRTADAEAVAELLRRVGPAMGDLAAELDKLCLHAGPGGRVDAEAVRRLVPVSVEQSVFGLAEEIAAMRTDRAVSLL